MIFHFLHSKRYVLLLVFAIVLWSTILRHLDFVVGNDSVFYDDTGLSIAQGHGFTRMHNGSRRFVTAQSPGYSYFLGAVYILGGYSQATHESLSDDSPRVTFAIFVQLVMVIIATLWLGMQVRKRFGSLYGFVFLLCASTYVPTIIAAASLTPRALMYAFLSVYMGLYLSKLNTRFEWMFLVAAILMTVKPYFVILLLYTIFIYLISSDKRSSLWWLLGVVVLFSGYWSFRIYLQTGDIALMQAGASYVISTGACPEDLCVREGGSILANVLRSWWWYGIGKMRELLFMPAELNHISTFLDDRPVLTLFIRASHALIVYIGFFGFYVSGVAKKHNHLEIPNSFMILPLLAFLPTWSHIRYFYPFMVIVMLFFVKGFYVLRKARIRRIFFQISIYMLLYLTFSELSRSSERGLWIIELTSFLSIFLSMLGAFFLSRIIKNPQPFIYRLLTTIIYWHVLIAIGPYLFNYSDQGSFYMFPIGLQLGDVWQL